MTSQSAIANEAPNRRADALPFGDFRTMILYGWDKLRPKEMGFITMAWFLQLKFIVLTCPVVRWQCEIDQEILGEKDTTGSFCWAPCGRSTS